ncbi:carbohydrate kinase [Kocuria rosea subsp. polaris]|uniref:Carbohydrate kinase n=1 Tax=Kocuria rosea subsp. polaris TaxID=136273 RepID=A0A0W8IM71_KOCRO|nr:PfkB family carbohydrate kinase [Kocuria polaris]KUG60970.1 carbohydrate kinase [Kocuria polaris]
MSGVVVVGQVARDLVLTVEELPAAGGSTDVLERQELLGGKGANQAVGCRQLGAEVQLVGVVGRDRAGEEVLAQAAGDGIGVGAVVRRSGASTALLVDLVGPRGVRRLLEDVDARTLLTAEDVRASRDLLRSADAVLVQLQQPGPAVAEALEAAAAGGALTVADGGPADEDVRRRVLATAAVVRADTAEAEALVGWAPQDVPGTVRAARSLLAEGPRVVALATGEGDVVAWPGGHVVLPHLGEDPVDPTGAGDAFVAALTVALLRGESPESAAWWAAAAAAQVVGTAGGRPDLDPDRLRESAARARP